MKSLFFVMHGHWGLCSVSFVVSYDWIEISPWNSISPLLCWKALGASWGHAFSVPVVYNLVLAFISCLCRDSRSTWGESFQIFPGHAHSSAVLCSFMWWSVKCGHNGDTGKSQENKMYCTQKFYKQEAWNATQDHVRNTRFWSGDRIQKWGESLGQSLYWGFLWKGKTGQGKEPRIE